MAERGRQSRGDVPARPARRRRKWSQEVSEHSDALDIDSKTFSGRNAAAIARSLKRSAQASDRRKSTPFRAAMSMLSFYVNRAGANLSPRQKRTLEAAKNELRKAFGRAPAPWQRSMKSPRRGTKTRRRG
ncbi:MAG: DUF3175 domain-containing protein [Bradyrhizobium sp.]|nr:MAG: DUF3175 domain-containing protein [Bradyrhizobium sp.]